MNVVSSLRAVCDKVADAVFDSYLAVEELLFGSETRRAEGMQHAQTPGEVSGANSPDPSPSPGDLNSPSELTDSDFLAVIATALDEYAGRTPFVVRRMQLLNLADAARDRAAQFAALESISEK